MAKLSPNEEREWQRHLSEQRMNEAVEKRARYMQAIRDATTFEELREAIIEILEHEVF